MKSRIFVLAVVVMTFATALLAAPAMKSLEKAAVPFDRVDHFQRMFTLQANLHASAEDLAAIAPLEVRVTAEERRMIREGGAADKKMMVGVARELAIPMEFSREQMTGRAQTHEAFGAMRGRGDGTFTWAGTVRSPEAAAVRVRFTDVQLPEGSELYVYSNDGMAFGPYTGRGPNGTGEFWSNTVAGAEIVVVLRAGVEGAPRFTVAGLGHMTPEFAIADSLVPKLSAMAAQPNCSFNASCVVGANCVATDSAVNDAKNAVAHILFVSGAYYYICSGGLVADSDTGSTIPYFITANHCISRSGEASSLETFFFYTSACGSCPDPGSASTTGATIVSTGSAADYTLLRLGQNAPSGAAYLGWYSEDVAFVNGTPLYRISHPQGAPQSYSTQVVDTSKGTCRSWPRGDRIYSRDTLGATEGGSSGSPVVNGAGQLVGQLSGACGTNVNDVCDDANNATVDGAFAAYYNTVSQWLGGGGGGGCIDADGDGVCASEGDCNDNNAKVYPGANDTRGKQGRDGIDNDCDGVADK